MEGSQGKEGGRLTGKDEWKVGKGMVGVRWARKVWGRLPGNGAKGGEHRLSSP